MRHWITIIPACLFGIASCMLLSCGDETSSEEDSGSADVKVSYPVEFPYPKTPSTIIGEDALCYAAEHFWDLFSDTSRHCPGDTSMVSGVARSDVEAAVSNYIALLKSIDLDRACSFVNAFTRRLIACETADSSSTVFDAVGKMFERYAFDPNSPVRDEDLYAPYARVMASCPFVSEARRSAFTGEADLCMLNRRGSKATDFSFTYRDGRCGSLYEVEAPYTLLFFSNPGCKACKEIIDVLSSDGNIAGMIDGGSLSVINIYIDEDLTEWYKYMPIYPENWHNVYDESRSIREDELYNVRAIPSLYLLDKDKTVLLKDAPPEAVYRNLEQIMMQ